jgi:hypothetical protein
MFSHEAGHLIEKYAEKTGMLHGGKPIKEAVTELVHSLPIKERIALITKLESYGVTLSDRTIRYLSGDIKTAGKAYLNETPKQVRESAAWEFMAQLSAMEIVQRVKLPIPGALRTLINKLKAVTKMIASYFSESKDIATMQDLRKISRKMLDAFRDSDPYTLSAVFPTSHIYHAKPMSDLELFDYLMESDGTRGKPKTFTSTPSHPQENISVNMENVLNRDPNWSDARVAMQIVRPHILAKSINSIESARRLEVFANKLEAAGFHDSNKKAAYIRKAVQLWEDSQSFNLYTSPAHETAARTAAQMRTDASEATITGPTTLRESLRKYLPREVHVVLEQIVDRIEKASGQKIDFRTSLDPTADAQVWPSSGRLDYNIAVLASRVRDREWGNMSGQDKADFVHEFLVTLGHEVGHVVETYAEATGMLHKGRPLADAIPDIVNSLPVADRRSLMAQLQKYHEGANSHLFDYFAGDLVEAKKVYPTQKHKALERMAAWEFMAQITSMEIAHRVQFPEVVGFFRRAVDLIKDTVLAISSHFSKAKDVAALQELQQISRKMLDAFHEAKPTELGEAFPASQIYNPHRNVDMSQSSMPRKAPPSAPILVTVAKPFLDGELRRLAIRTTIGGVIGGIAGPRATDRQMTLAEGILLGGVMGAFGPKFASKIMSGDITAALKAGVLAKSPKAAFVHLMGGKTLRELGAEGE